MDTYVLWDGVTYRIQQITVDDSQASHTLVFLHDALGSVKQWKQFPKQLAASLSMNAVIIERQGHGQSSEFSKSRTTHYLHEQAFDVLPNLLELLHINDPILIGHSDGGTLALLYASKFDCTAVVSLAAHVMLEEITLQGIRDTLEQRASLKAQLAKYHFSKTEALIHNWSDTWLSPEFQSFNLVEELKQITAPVLVIQSDDDAYGSWNQVETIMLNVASVQKESYRVTDGGHAPHLTKGSEVVVVISDFVSKVL